MKTATISTALACGWLAAILSDSALYCDTDRDCRNAALFGAALFGASCGLLVAAIITL